ncbi:MAG: hypothetical protein JRJ85_27310, partial [Deltaproteobacteria bacterium]|nr:hypothetical protein [Deltaproteobacteria bacterium]
MNKDLIKFMAVEYTDEIRWEGKGAGRRLVVTRNSTLANGVKKETLTYVTSPEFRLYSFENVFYAPDGAK